MYPKWEKKKFMFYKNLFILQDLTTEEEHIAILRISGNLNLANSPLLEGQVVDVLSKEYGELETDQPESIIIDLSCVSHLDASACQQLMTMHRDKMILRQEKSRTIWDGSRGQKRIFLITLHIFPLNFRGKQHKIHFFRNYGFH